MKYRSLEQMAASAFVSLAPGEQLSVVQAAEKYVMIKRPGAHVGNYSIAKTPYLQEPQDELLSLDHDGMIFVAPARTGKSQMLQNWLGHTAKTDPTDMMVVHMTQSSGREWSKADLDKMLRDSDEIRALLRPGRANDNTFDKEFLSGMRLSVTWPTANNLSGKTIRYNWLMDYDRMPDSIDGEGNAFDLTKKRATTFKRFGMTVAESSPNPDKEITNPKWTPKTPHEGPPIKGIFELYNRGDRRRWYWRCPHCNNAFEPTFSLFNYPDSADPMEAAEMTTLKCPARQCGFDMLPEMKDELNTGGRWVREGLVWLPDNTMVAREGMRPTRSNIASFWLQGPAAAFQDWSSLVLEYLRAEAAYEATGDEEPLKKTVTTDQGSYYIPKARMSERMPEDLKSKAEDWGADQHLRTVAPDVRFLIATVDVQARAFVVQVQGFTCDGDEDGEHVNADGTTRPARASDMVIIDGFKIRKSARTDADGDFLPIDPASYAEDWDLLIEQVIQKTYPLADGTGHMQIKITGCDSGGREGVTHQAYEFWRRLKKGVLVTGTDGEAELVTGLHRRFALVKGDGSKNAPRTQVTWPDSNRRDKYAVAKGDVPVVRLNADMLKDQVAAMLGRRVSEEEEGGGMIRFPTWMEDWLYAQLTTEIRTPRGWENPAKRRNESWDLLYYALALALRPADQTCPIATVGFYKIDWTAPPGWAAPWPANDLVTQRISERRFSSKPPERPSFADLAKKLA